MKTAPTNKKIRELIRMIKEGKLASRPDFQRRLVWSRNDKNLFLDTILRGYPFPEIYLADGEVDLVTGEGTQLLVDGQQRVNTIIQYFDGDPDLKLTIVPSYDMLGEDEKKTFLQYDVAVRDIGAVNREDVIEVFRRINATKYSLLEIEVSNAVYSGALKSFVEKIASHDFFSKHSVFTPQDYRRMGDLRYVLSIVATMLVGYFNRDDEFISVLDRFNDDFPMESVLSERVLRVIDFIEECGFEDRQRVWKKADLLTLFVEVDSLFVEEYSMLSPSDVVARLSTFYFDVDAAMASKHPIVAIYYKAALQASNDRLNRVRRGVIVRGLLKGEPYDTIYQTLGGLGLIQ